MQNGYVAFSFLARLESGMKIGDRVSYNDPDSGVRAGTVVKLREADDGVWVRLDGGERVLAFPEDLRTDWHPANVATIQDAINTAHQAGRKSEAELLSAALKGGTLRDPADDRGDVASEKETTDGVDTEAPPAGVLRTQLDPIPQRAAEAPTFEAPVVQADPDVCPRCGKRAGMRQEIVRGGGYAYRCMERIGVKQVGAGLIDNRPFCGGTWKGGEAPIPSMEAMR